MHLLLISEESAISGDQSMEAQVPRICEMS